MKSNNIIIVFIAIVLCVYFLQGYTSHVANERRLDAVENRLAGAVDSTPWVGTNAGQLPMAGQDAALVRYGYELVTHTNRYLGADGSIGANNNAMTCQNCHLEAGTKAFGNNFGKVFATYPQYRSRNDGVQTVMMRLQDCFRRSMNGRAPDTTSREMKAIYAYIRWLDDGVRKGSVPIGTKMPTLPYLDRAADPRKGASVYTNHCTSCHGGDGLGQYDREAKAYTCPPLWGQQSFNDGAGLNRISNMAAFIHYNMPNGTTYKQPALSVEDSWDVAAYLLSKVRPHFDPAHDYRNLRKKPVDDPFGPYLDRFPQVQHKYGPFAPIKQFYTSINQQK